jgi:hypothetical protein
MRWACNAAGAKQHPTHHAWIRSALCAWIAQTRAQAQAQAQADADADATSASAGRSPAAKCGTRHPCSERRRSAGKRRRTLLGTGVGMAAKAKAKAKAKKRKAKSKNKQQKEKPSRCTSRATRVARALLSLNWCCCCCCCCCCCWFGRSQEQPTGAIDCGPGIMLWHRRACCIARRQRECIAKCWRFQSQMRAQWWLWSSDASQR